MSTYSQLSWIYRRAICTGENMNMVRRSSVSPDGPLIPAAASGEQRHFEASFLLSWAEATAKQGSPVPSFISAIHPAPDCLAITVSCPTTLMPLLRRVLPRWVNDRVVGTPGLRVYPWRDFLELRMLGAENDVRARIRLLGVNRSRHQGREFLAEAGRTWPACRPLYLERTLFPGELSSVSTAGTGQDSLLSDLLRRFPLWRTADLVSVGLTAGAASVRWRGSPSSTTILDVLRSPGCGVPHGLADLSSARGGNEIAFLDDRAPERGVVEPWAAWEAIHTAQTGHAKRVAVAPRTWSSSVPPEAWEDPEMRSARVAESSEAADWVKFFNEDDVYSMIGTVHTVLAQKVDTRHTKYAIPALTLAPGRIGMTDVRQVEAATRALRALDYQYGGGFCRAVAAAQTLSVEGLLATAKGAEIRGRLKAAIAERDAIGARGLWLPDDRWMEMTGGESHG